ncbi:MAG: LysR family transcriptional regulator [Myxococcota bacterium]
MIEKLRSMAIFATVVDKGSFRAAGRQLGLSPSRISETVSDLEQQLGVTLMYRSTRRMSLTHEGHVLYAEAKRMLEAAESGLDAIRPASSEPQGALKVAAPAFVTQSALMDTFADFAKAYPRVQLDLDFSDHRRDLIKEGFDVAVRAGQLESSELRARSIGVTQRRLVASPAYVASKDLPLHPRDLESWDWVRFALRSEQIHFTSPDGETLSVQGSSHVVVDSASALQALVVRGLGLSVLPEDLAAHGCERGELVHVLPGWSLRPLGLYVVWPQQARRANLTMIFIRFLADRGGRRGSDDPA